jgi:hypothetical protein
MDIGRRKPRRKAHHAHARQLAFDSGQFFVDAFGRLHHGALTGHRHQKRQRAPRFGRTSAL